jgi:hypothetical protein
MKIAHLEWLRLCRAPFSVTWERKLHSGLLFRADDRQTGSYWLIKIPNVFTPVMLLTGPRPANL